MKLRITKIQEFRNSPNDPPVYEITGDIASGFGRPEISSEYELSPIGAATPAAVHQAGAQPSAAAPARSPAAAGAGNVTQPRFLGKQTDEVIACRPLKITAAADGKRVVVAYQVAQQEAGRLKAYDLYMACWDAKLFAAVKATKGTDAEFFVERKKATDGKLFTNIVGVKVKAGAVGA